MIFFSKRGLTPLTQHQSEADLMKTRNSLASLLPSLRSLSHRSSRRRLAAVGSPTTAAAEVLEARKLLSATNDFDDQASEARNMGQLSASPVSVDGTISFPKDVDAIKFEAQAGQTISAVLSSMSGLQPRLRLFGPMSFGSSTQAQPLQSAFEGQRMDFEVTRSGTYYFGVSELSNQFYNINSGGFDAVDSRATTGAYRLTFADTSDEGSSSERPDLKAKSISGVHRLENGKSEVTVSFEIENDGGRTNEAIDIDFYASDNTYISSYDELLGSTTIPAMDADSSTSVRTVTLNLPDHFKATDDFFLGMVIDPNNDIRESNETNNDNTGRGIDYSFLDVQDVEVTPPDSPTNILVAGNDTPTITWDDADRADSYDIWVTNVGTGRMQFLESDVVKSEFTFPADTPAGRYRVWVRSGNGAGHSGWKSSAAFSIGNPPERCGTASISSTDTDGTWLSWIDSARASRYEVWINDLDNGGKAFHQQDLSSPLVSLDSILGSGRYKVWVRAGNVAGWGLWSTASSFRIREDGSGVNETLATPVLGGDNTVNQQNPTFTWEAVGGATHYEIWVNNLQTGRNIISERNVTDTSYTSNIDLSDGQYRVWVRAASEDAFSRWSRPKTITVENVEVPAQSLVTGPESHSNERPTVTWIGAAKADHYRVTVRHEATYEIVAQSDVVTGASWTIDQDLEPGAYVVSVEAGNEAGWGPESEKRSFTVTRTAALQAPTFNNRPLFGSTTFVAQFQWTNVPGADRYEYMVEGTGRSNIDESLIASTDQTSGSLNLLKERAEAGVYTLRVRAVNETGNGPWSAPVDFFYRSTYIYRGGVSYDGWILGTNT